MKQKIDNNAFRNLSYGLYIVTSKHGGIINGQLVNTVIQVTSEPPCIAVIINKSNYTHELILKSAIFTAIILNEDVTMNFLGPFGFRSGRDYDKFAKIGYKIGVTGSPIITENTLSFLESEIINSMNLETHTLFIGKVVNSEVLSKGNPLTYNYYHRFLKGKTSPKAPTFLP